MANELRPTEDVVLCGVGGNGGTTCDLSGADQRFDHSRGAVQTPTIDLIRDTKQQKGAPGWGEHEQFEGGLVSHLPLEPLECPPPPCRVFSDSAPAPSQLDKVRWSGETLSLQMDSG